MADLVISIANHGYSDEDPVYVSWLDNIYYVADKNNYQFKLTTTAGGSTYLQWTENIVSGYIREVDETSGVKTVTGLNYLEGKNVYVTSNGRLVGEYPVSNGAITVPEFIFTYAIGLKYTSLLQPMKIDLGGLGLSVTKKLSRAVVSLQETVGGEIGPNQQNLDKIVYRKVGEGGEEYPYFSGDIEVKLPGGYSRQGDIMIRQAEPRPMTVLALSIDVGANDD